MIDVNNICSLTAFQRNAKTYIRKLHKTELPIVLTVNGQASAILLNPQEYQEMIDRLEYADTVAAIRQSMKEFEEGKGIPLEVARARLRKNLGIQNRNIGKGRKRSHADSRLDARKPVRARSRQMV